MLSTIKNAEATLRHAATVINIDKSVIMKLLYITPYVPYPLNSGGNQAFFTLTNLVRQKHEVSILLFAHTNKEEEHIAKLKELWPNVTFYVYKGDRQQIAEEEVKQNVLINAMPWTDRTACRFFSYLQSSMKRKIKRRMQKAASKSVVAFDVDFVRHHSTLFMGTEDLVPGFCSYVKEVAAKGFDAIQVEFYDYLPLVFFFPQNVRKVFIHHELRFVRNSNEMGLYQELTPSDILLFEKEKAQELFYLWCYDAVVTLTKIDKDILSEYIPEKKLFVSPAITQTVALEHKTFRPARELVFVGSGAHFPNADAMVWFCKEVYPILKTKLPEPLRVNVVGQWDSGLKSNLKEACPDVFFPGFVDDLQAFLNGKISIVPIRIGSGMRMKILDSVFAATPIITTSKGCEGLPMVDGENCLIADDADAFADAICRMVDDTKLQEQLAVAAQHSKTNMLNERELLELRLAVYHEKE